MTIRIDEHIRDDLGAMTAADPGEMLRAVASSGAQVRQAATFAAEADLDRLGHDGRPRLLGRVAWLPGLAVVGLVAVPAPRQDPEELRPAFARLGGLREELTLQHPGLRGLSMGMSADFEVAIAEGASCVRIGTALFGPRSSP